MPMLAVVTELVGAAEIAEMLGGVSRQRVTQITGKPHFPKPAASLAMGKVWKRRDVEKWIAKNRPGAH